MIIALTKERCTLEKFGERLRRLREEKGLKQTELVKLLNLESSSTVSQYETTNRIPDAHILQKLADILNCSVDYLLGRTHVRTTPHIQAAHIEGDTPVTEEALNIIEAELKKIREELKETRRNSRP